MSDAIQTLWIGAELSTLEQLCLASFRDHGHDVQLFTYGPVRGVPRGIAIQDASQILGEERIFHTRGNSVACFADWFRWKLLYERGGYWVDTDVVCLRKFDFTEPLLFGRESSDRASIGVLRADKGNKVAKLMADNCQQPNKVLPYDAPRIRARKWIRRWLRGNRHKHIKFGESGGPKGFTKALRYHGLLETGKPFTYFYPVHFENWRCIFDETFASGLACFQDTYAVHLWNECLRREGVDKNGDFPAGSMFEQLKRKHQVTPIQ